MADASPRCTYRLQLSREFPFEAAASRARYLASLGVSHVYSSPFLQAAAESTHGYDVVDPHTINRELGGESGFRRFTSALQKSDLKLLMDVVPNHMATAGRANPWWWDLLQHGKSSPYAGYFDIDWEPPMSHLKGKVLLGVLADRYGRELEAGRLVLDLNGEEAVVRYQDNEFPISGESLEGLGAGAIGEDGRVRAERSPDLDTLDALLQRQHYRLAYWRTAQEELNYRRFFTVDSLIGLRVELEQVLKDSHRLVFELLAGGDVAGLRVDHLDGLLDPESYLFAVRSAAPDAYLVVEKVLESDEKLPVGFPVQGTTGYDFIAHVDGVFVDSENEEPMTTLYHAFTGESLTYAEVIRTCKNETMVSELAPDLERLTSLLVEICDRYRHQRDRTRRELQDAIREVAAALSVYRTYVRPGLAIDEDRRRVAAALEEAGRRAPEMDPELLAFVGELLVIKRDGHLEREFAARFQQFTPAVMAKGVEDTAFYRYNRLVSLNEVGGDPEKFGRTVERFHEYCAQIASNWPATMLTLSTHDTKRSADVRARINLLSEIPIEWGEAVRRWADHNQRHRSQGFPDRNIEYLMYQTLVGAWRLDLPRLAAFLQKAAREARVHTSWMNPVAVYEETIRTFASNVLADGEFMRDLEAFIGRHDIVSLGRQVSLGQSTLLLTCPGVPDLYQGTEVWDLSLVDPDNRRQVDYEYRERLLSEVQDMGPQQALARSADGSSKLWLIARLLGLRRSRPDLFETTGYAPLTAVGAKARHVLSFVRGGLVVVVPRLLVGLGGDWAGTSLELPPGRWRDVLTGDEHDGGAAIQLDKLLETFAVAVLAADAG
ncbi:MAG: malto-oligosyltrehalose synthase [Candidatus Dormibacteraceae bacterium]